MDINRQAAILEQIHRRDVKDVTEDELDYCRQRALASTITVDDRPQMGLTQKGKDWLQKLRASPA